MEPRIDIMSRPSNLQLFTQSSIDQQQDSMPPVPNRMSPNVVSRPLERYGFNRGSFEEAKSLNYYYGKIPNKQVEELLRPHMDNRGSFLLRDSNTERGVITISVVDNPRHIYHFKVNYTANGLYEVTASLIFRTLLHLVEFFGINEVPGTNQLMLLTPVRYRQSPKASPRSPQSDQIPTRPPRQDPRLDRSQPAAGPGVNSASFLDFRAPLPIPKPGTEPIYIDHDHVYCRAGDLKKSRIDEIMELCKISDEKYKKCTCGLYMEQSILVEDWMMHIDRPEGDHEGTNRVFFVNTVTSQALWELPERTMQVLGQQFPQKKELVLKLLQEGSNL